MKSIMFLISQQFCSSRISLVTSSYNNIGVDSVWLFTNFKIKWYFKKWVLYKHNTMSTTVKKKVTSVPNWLYIWQNIEVLPDFSFSPVLLDIVSTDHIQYFFELLNKNVNFSDKHHWEVTENKRNCSYNLFTLCVFYSKL